LPTIQIAVAGLISLLAVLIEATTAVEGNKA
jgi:hypothetical protein